VVNVASWGMSGSPMLDERCWHINIRGTEVLLEACELVSVRRFIYTSTYNVIFGGQTIENGDETIDYFPFKHHSDCYSGSKGQSEKLVREAHGRTLADGSTLITACLRPAAIYGEGEARHFPRIVKHMDSGIFHFRIGQATVDWVHIENLVQAYDLLIKKTLEHNGGASTQECPIYFISDGTPIDNFEFLRPLCVARGCSFPSLVLPLSLMLWVAFVFEKIYLWGKLFGLHIEPIFTRAEVKKVGVTHYFSIEKAKRELGYNPLVTSTEGAERMAEYYRQHFTNENYFQFAHPVWCFLVLAGMGLLYYVACWDTDHLVEGHALYYVKALAYAIFKTRLNLQIVLALACWTHIAEGVYAAYYAARVIKCTNTWELWLFQTVLLGYPSMKELLKRKPKSSV
jgi:nucleoside-diphosphate-sugar epimerase